MPNAVEKFLSHAAYEAVESDNKTVNTSMDHFVETVKKGFDCILYGPPGTSKTYMVDQLKDALGDAVEQMEIVQFHAGYSYEEFVEGIVPDVTNGGFKYENGSFLQFCLDAQAKGNPEKLWLFVIDEINRGNITAIFGEVLNLMENKGKRMIQTPKQKINFVIPPNVIIIGTMNTADKSLAKLDFALRRRFHFLTVYPSPETLNVMVSKCGFSSDVGITIEDYIACFNVLNAKITRHPLLGKEMMLGHVLWTKRGKDTSKYTEEEICSIFRETIFPQIETYCGSNRDVLANLLGTTLRDKLVYGYEISNSDIIEFLSGFKNSQVVNA